MSQQPQPTPSLVDLFLSGFFLTCQQIMPTWCCLWPINSAWLSLKFWTTCFSGNCNMSQVEKKVVNSPSEVQSLGSGFRVRLVLSPHPSGLEHTVIITTSHSHCHHTRREGSFLFTTDCRQLDPCNLEKYSTSQAGAALWLTWRFFPPWTAPALSQVFILLKLEDSQEWDCLSPRIWLQANKTD